MKYRRYWLLLGALFVLATLMAAGLTYYLESPHLVTRPPDPLPLHARLVRVPNSFAKYELCTEVYAFSQPVVDNPYKTDYSFHDPFRNEMDTITPRFMGRQAGALSASFTILVELRHVGKYYLTISNVQEKDGIGLLLPDAQNHLQAGTVPIFIVSGESSGVAVLDYTCPFQWNWKSTIQSQ